MKQIILSFFGLVYQKLLRGILFRFDSEKVHVFAVHFGKRLGESDFAKEIITPVYRTKSPVLFQNVAGINFASPVGLAAGFDYEANLTQILPALGFGFETVGTITNLPYEGNPLPRMGRLPKSKSLLVNKGFKNLGAEETIHNLTGLNFKMPVGVSLGRTNTTILKTQKESIADVVLAFEKFEHSNLKHQYYELNISCPNLFGNVTFYPPENLRELLREIDKLRLGRPVFVKMPIDRSDKETLTLLEIISKSSPKGVIFGNLQKNRLEPTLHTVEVAKFPVGNFSGKPTFQRSNELIKLSYRHFKKRLVIIGCGGVFSAADAYKKIALGSSLIELITGLIFQGPQLVAQINLGLADFLKRDGFSNISEAVGSED